MKAVALALFWLGTVLVTMAGLKLTALPDLVFHPVVILCFTVVCYYLDVAIVSTPTVIIMKDLPNDSTNDINKD